MSDDLRDLPTPIAAALAYARRCPPDGERLQRLFVAAEWTARYLALVSAARYLHTCPRQESGQVEAALQQLASRPSFGHWVSAFVAIEKVFREDPTFRVTLSEGLKLPHGLALKRQTGEWRKATISATGILNVFVELRNSRVHTKSRPLSKEEIPARCEQLEAALLELLAALDVAGSYPVYIERVERGRKMERVSKVIYVGKTPNGLVVEDSSHHPLFFTDGVVLYKGGEPTFLLSPLMIERNDKLYLLYEFPEGRPKFQSPLPDQDIIDPSEVASHFEEVAGHLFQSRKDTSFQASDLLKFAHETALEDGVISPDEHRMLTAIQKRFNLPELDLDDQLANSAGDDTEAEEVEPEKPAVDAIDPDDVPKAEDPIPHEVNPKASFDLVEQAVEFFSGGFESFKELMRSSNDDENQAGLDLDPWEPMQTNVVLDFNKMSKANGQFRLKFERKGNEWFLELKFSGEEVQVSLWLDDVEVSSTTSTLKNGQLAFTLKLPEGSRDLLVDQAGSIRISSPFLLGFSKTEVCVFDVYVRKSVVSQDTDED